MLKLFWMPLAGLAIGATFLFAAEPVQASEKALGCVSYSTNKRERLITFDNRCDRGVHFYYCLPQRFDRRTEEFIWRCAWNFAAENQTGGWIFYGNALSGNEPQWAQNWYDREMHLYMSIEWNHAFFSKDPAVAECKKFAREIGAIDGCR